MEAPSYPAPPDPKETAAAQTLSNKETAVANANLNRIDQYTPQGSTTYQVVGTNADGTPKYRQDTQFSAPEQQVYDTNVQTRQNIGQIGADQSQRIGGLLATPFDINTAANDQFSDIARKRLDPMWDQNYERKKTELLNSGIGIGTDAYDRSMSQFDQAKNDAYNSMFLQGRGQAVNEAMSQRNQPINEISALMSGSQVSNPAAPGVPQAGVANTDVAGITNNAFNQQMQVANANNQSNNAMMGGLFGLGSMGLYKWSDRELKTNIKRIGTAANGLPIYAYRYKAGGPMQIGFMAQDVEKVRPEAVQEFGGFKAVDYGRAV